MFRLALLFLLSLPILASAQTPSSSDLPQMLLGKGMIGHLNSACKVAKDLRRFDPQLETRESVKSRCTEERNETLFLALECVAHDSTGALTCAQIQPVLMSVEKNAVIQRGTIQEISDHDGQPTQKEIKSYLKNIHGYFKHYQSQHETLGQKAVDDVIQVFAASVFLTGVLAVSAATGGIGGPVMAAAGTAIGVGTFFMASGLFSLNSDSDRHPEQIDTNSYNWSVEQRKVRSNQFTAFSNFMLNFKP